MNLESFRLYCLNKENVTEEFPFGEDTLVFKVKGKIFVIAGMEPFEGINLKCDPEKAIQLREQYEAVQPGYHMNKKHWNTVAMDGSIPDKLVKEWIDHSYDLVAGKPSVKKSARKKE
ncbi:MAG TPA: MmcQ/YjbR family DNA-binding protein [Cyclobacteriaceae bacterium]|nr:MmcQ/YjbR family DNA-binding protein [Cyclobacteriaceae bacterium]